MEGVFRMSYTGTGLKFFSIMWLSSKVIGEYFTVKIYIFGMKEGYV